MINYLDVVLRIVRGMCLSQLSVLVELYGIERKVTWF